MFNESHTVPFVISAVVAILALSNLSCRLIETSLRRKGQEISARILRSASQ